MEIEDLVLQCAASRAVSKDLDIRLLRRVIDEGNELEYLVTTGRAVMMTFRIHSILLARDGDWSAVSRLILHSARAMCSIILLLLTYSTVGFSCRSHRSACRLARVLEFVSI